ncbi:class I SAM-dependent methyltransferase [Micromonospora sp. DT47]|uniref:class I SAM-dependent methyltransferase n=1 Tax=Micromonospora sp. DT47 TaxID=3393431 RepID=UPI003CE8B600
MPFTVYNLRDEGSGDPAGPRPTVSTEDVMPARSHPVFARVYERLSLMMDRAGGAEHRHDLVAGLSGRVIEIGAGNGRMFAHYPPAVTEVVAVEPEPRLRATAITAARTASVHVTVVDGLAEALPATDGEFDAAVVALVLCTVPDPAAALAEIRRALRPGGELRFFEHVAAEQPGGMRRVQRLADATLWPKLFAGCRTSRDTATAISDAGFLVEYLHRFRFPTTGPSSPAAPHISGRAVNPANESAR